MFIELKTPHGSRLINPGQIAQVVITEEAAIVYLADGGRVELDGASTQVVLAALRAAGEIV